MGVFKFHVEIAGDVAATDGALPIYDDNGILVGGFTVYVGDLVIGFISGRNHPLALEISLEDDIWFTPHQGRSGLIEGAAISLYPISSVSYKIHPQEEACL